MKQSKLIIAVAVLVGVVLGAGGIQLLRTSSNATASCDSHNHAAHGYSIMIMDGNVEPNMVAAKLCDMLTITNMDSKAREIGFGDHDHHTPYDGISEKVLNRDQSLTVTLHQPGTFHFHDHLEEAVAGSFVVTP